MTKPTMPTTSLYNSTMDAVAARDAAYIAKK